MGVVNNCIPSGDETGISLDSNVITIAADALDDHYIARMSTAIVLTR